MCASMNPRLRALSASSRPYYYLGRTYPLRTFCSSSDRPNSDATDPQTGTSAPPPPPPHFHQIPNFRHPPPPPPPPQHYLPNQHFRPPPPPNYLFRSPPPPDFRSWELAKSVPNTASDRFTVLSYNLLADYLVWEHRAKLYNHIPRHILDWQYRRINLLTELTTWSTDIMCFQEVDMFHDLEMELKKNGYTGIWKIRTGEPADGCAMFWRESRFNLLYEESIEFNDFGLRNNVAQICVLELVKQSTGHSASPGSSDSKKVVICNVHVLFNPKRGEIKLAQVRILLNKAHAVSKNWNDAPLVLCGDFNSVPKSPMYKYISEQKLDLSMIGRDDVSGQASAEIRVRKVPWTSPRTFRSGENVVAAPSTVQRTGDGIQNKSSSDILKSENLDGKIENALLSRTTLGPEHSNAAEESSKVKHGDDEGKLDKVKEETQQSSVINPGHRSGSSTPEISHSIESDGSNYYPFKIWSHDQDGFSGPSAADSSFLTKFDEEERRNEAEDDTAFLSKLLNTNDGAFPQHSSNTGVENDQYPNSKEGPHDVGQNLYDPSSWSPEDLEMATGIADCTNLEHPLKLKSTYTEAEDRMGIRDSNGEPLVTTHHKWFLGTVDYIWRSEGLQTVRVLAPIPKHVIQATSGFPTRKWGSDHIALATELGFAEDQTQS